MREAARKPLEVGRYALGSPIASGGMATLHLGRLVGSAGFSRTVAIKRLHPHLCGDAAFAEMFADEARLAARIRHPNVVPTLDVVATEESDTHERELLLVMEYIDGESLATLSKDGRIPLPIVVAIVSEMLHGLHSAHEAKGEDGQALGIVHRDVSPQNVLVGADGVARLVDFGIARATNRAASSTGQNELKGKLAYMAPEQLRFEGVTRQTDIFAAGIVLWELLTGQRLFASENAGSTVEKILVGWVAPPSTIAKDLQPGLDEIALRALDADPNQRFGTAREMAVALEDALPRALGRDVATWVETTAAKTLARRRDLVARAERAGSDAPPSMRVDRPAPPPVTPRQEVPEATMDSVTTALRSPREDVVVRENEATVTTFSADDMFAPTVDLGSGIHAAPPFGPAFRAPAPPRRRMALAAFTIGALLTCFVGAGYSSIRSSTQAAAATSELASEVPAATELAPPAPATTPVVAPSASFVAPVMIPAPTASPAPPPSAAAPRARVRPRAPVAAAPAKAPCVAKVDPATQKKVYQGDCN